MNLYSQPQIQAAIDVEALQWAQFFGVTAPDRIEARKQVMRANVAVGYLEPLMPYLFAEGDTP